jgi:long-chain acyl-CoA synthetase
MNSNQVSLVSLFEEAIRDNWDLKALSDYGGTSFTYKEVGERILQIHSLFLEVGIKKGDKISLLGKNSAQWGILYIATVTYGAVIVPILPDFKPSDVHHIVTHSDSLLLFVEEAIFKELDPAAMPLLQFILKIPDLSVLFSRLVSLQYNSQLQTPNLLRT